MATTSLPEKCMVSQIRSSLTLAGSRIQVPNVCCTVTKWTGLPTDVMTHSGREQAHVGYLGHSNSEQQLLMLCGSLPAFLEGPGLLSSAFPARVSSFGTAHTSPRAATQKGKTCHFSIFDITDVHIGDSTKIQEWQPGFCFVWWKKKSLGWSGQEKSLGKT